MRRHASEDEAYMPLVQALGTNPARNRSFKLTIGILFSSDRVEPAFLAGRAARRDPDRFALMRKLYPTR
jgi:hypothetical protein